jgi:hypothetical protein
MGEKLVSTLEDFVTPIRKHSEECTPGGVPRYEFLFGRRPNRKIETYTLFKFFRHKSIIDPPECMLTSFSLSHFVKSAEAVGLHISAAEQRQLKGE